MIVATSITCPCGGIVICEVEGALFGSEPELILSEPFCEECGEPFPEEIVVEEMTP